MQHQDVSENSQMTYHGDNANTSIRKLKYLLWMFIFITILLNGLEWSLGGNTLTPERFFAIPLLLTVFFLLLVLREAIPVTHASILLIIWLLIALASSLTSTVSNWSLKMYLGQLFAVTFYFVTIWIRPDYSKIFCSFTFFSFAWFFGPLLSTVYIVSFYIDLPMFMQFWLQEGSGGTRLKATIYEANLLGVLLIFFNLMVLALGHTRKLWWWFLLIGLNFSLLFTFSRVPWVSYILALMVYALLATPRLYSIELLSRYLLVILISCFGVFILGCVIYFIFGDLEIIGRLHSLRTRLIMWELALGSFLANPIIGNGMFSFSELFSYAPSLVGSNTERSAWISNITLALLHDTGIIGALIFFAFLFWVLLRGAFSVRHTVSINNSDRYITKIGAALVSFGVALFVTGQTIPAHSLAFFWAFLALIERYSIVMFNLRNE